MSEKLKILYVDDETINLTIFELSLKGVFNIATADSGQKGLDILAEDDDISLVVSDLRMPIMDGLAFITEANERHPDKIFYLLTGYELSQEIQEALDSGLIKKYFSKPIKMQDLSKAIDHDLEGNKKV